VKQGYLTTEEGAAWKESAKGGDYSEMRGGVSFAWNWGSVVLAKDHFQWEMRITDRTFSQEGLLLSLFPASDEAGQMVRFYLCYRLARFGSGRFHPFLPGSKRNEGIFFQQIPLRCHHDLHPLEKPEPLHRQFRDHLFEKLQSRLPEPIPVLCEFNLFRDSSQKAHYGRNSQLFFNISSRQVKHLHLYASVLIDDLGSKKFSDSTTENCISWKAGFRASNLLNQNLTFTAEYTRTTPHTYSDPVPTLTFESNRYNLGSYLRDNSQEAFISLGYRPVRGLMFNLSWNWAEHGGATDTKTLKTVVWSYDARKVEVTYEFINNAYVSLAYQYLNITGDSTLSPPIFQGHQSILSGGINIGF